MNSFHKKYASEILALVKELQDRQLTNTVLIGDLIENIQNRYLNASTQAIGSVLSALERDGCLSRPGTGLYRLPHY
ncbi:hypothetical protein [Deinococcus hopiensis]|uniref:hypothetical protein n=1 Tax=Deinococcus hopiensis TaxID=309885 RepID=UPI00111C722D|nr:hypothetical protein [Deinococcus hopiensis]